MRAVHDMGGLPAGPVTPADHERERWEKRTDAMGALLRARNNMIRLDELRRNAESLGDRYLRLSYGERTLHGLSQTLIEHGIISLDELSREMARLEENAKS